MNSLKLISTLFLVHLFCTAGAQKNPPAALTQKANIRHRTVAIKASDTLPMKIYREVTRELPADKDAVVKITNTFFNLEIRSWPEAKVKMIGTFAVAIKDTAGSMPEDILDQLGIGLTSSGSRVTIQTRSVVVERGLSNTLGGTPSRAVVVFDQDGKRSTLMANEQTSKTRISAAGSRAIVLFVPEACKLDVDNQSSSITIQSDIVDAKFKLNHSTLDAQSFKKLFIAADYSAVSMSDAAEAELEFKNGSFTARNLQWVDLDSKNSEIDYESSRQLYIRSHSDRIWVDEAGSIAGRKLYGDFRIGMLTSELDLEGVNSDIRVRNVSPLVNKIKVSDQYANLRLPVKNLTNFEVMFQGETSTVFAPFGRILMEEQDSVHDTSIEFGVKIENEAGKLKKTSPAISKEKLEVMRKAALRLPEREREAFLAREIKGAEAEVLVLMAQPQTSLFNSIQKKVKRLSVQNGDITGQHTRFDITCNYCTIDFK